MLPMLPDNQSYSFEKLDLMLLHCFSLLFIVSDGTDATDATWQPALFVWKNWNACFCIAFALLFIASEATDATDATDATSMLPDNQPYSFEKTGMHAFALLFIASDAADATDATWQPALFIW